MNIEKKEIQKSIFEELTVEFKNQPTFNPEILKLKIKDAYRKVRARKCYENTSFSEEKINQELYYKYYQDIKDVARYNFATIGADFEVSHSEGDISRTWRTEDEILGNLTSYVKVF